MAAVQISDEAYQIKRVQTRSILHLSKFSIHFTHTYTNTETTMALSINQHRNDDGNGSSGSGGGGGGNSNTSKTETNSLQMQHLNNVIFALSRHFPPKKLKGEQQ